MRERGRISDIFFSFQGEGLYLGEPQIFLRFAGCNISPKCLYCDTSAKVNKEMTVGEILAKIERAKWPTRFIALTGGEPLLQVNFLKRLLPALKRRGFRIYLETNGTLPEALSHIIEEVDIIAMDIKLPSSGRTAALWERQSQFLNVVSKKIWDSPQWDSPHFFMVKVVLTGDTEKNDLVKAISLVEAAPYIPFILQPVTPNKKVKGVRDKKLREFHSLARRRLENVSIVPQVHKVLGIR